VTTSHAQCPWYITSQAASRYAALRGIEDFVEARDALIHLAAETWHTYESRDKTPKQRKDGAVLYRSRGLRGQRIWFVVRPSASQQAGQAELAVVDVYNE
jgi:hypothetical protein